MGVISSVSNGQKIRRKDVKTYTVDGVTYSYHRDTGTRLPDDPTKWPSAIAQIKTMEKSQSKALKKYGFSLPVDTPIRDVTPRHTPEMIAYTVRQTIHFILNASASDTLLYHSGDLANDCVKDQMLRERQGYLLMIGGFGIAYLHQQRVRPGWSHYFATRSNDSLSGIPRHALHGDITPDEYQSLNAINERQSAVSITRCIRDALGINDQLAADMRNTMIKRGWLTNGRPPELTDIGLEMLT